MQSQKQLQNLNEVMKKYVSDRARSDDFRVSGGRDNHCNTLRKRECNMDGYFRTCSKLPYICNVTLPGGHLVDAVIPLLLTATYPHDILARTKALSVIFLFKQPI